MRSILLKVGNELVFSYNFFRLLLFFKMVLLGYLPCGAD